MTKERRKIENIELGVKKKNGRMRWWQGVRKKKTRRGMGVWGGQEEVI